MDKCGQFEVRSFLAKDSFRLEEYTKPESDAREASE